MNYRAIIVDAGGVIRNRIMAGPQTVPPPGCTLHAESEAGNFTEQVLEAVMVPVSKLTIMNRLGDEKWELFETILTQMPKKVRDSWTLAQEIDPQNGLFLAHRDALQVALGLKDDEFTALFAPL